MSALMNGPTSEILIEILKSAIRAPSGHNSQPWRFMVYEDAVDLYADRRQALPVSDPDDRELTISCGCALLTLRVAAAAFGYVSTVKTFPGNSHRDLLARISISPAALPDDDALLEPFIERRHTYRGHFTVDKVPDDVKRNLQGSASLEHCNLQFIDDGMQRQAVITLICEADAMLWSNPDWRRELASWIRPRRHGDGIAVNSLVVPVTRSMVRNFDMGHRIAERNRVIAEQAPVLAMISTDGDTPRHWLAAGQALQRVLLNAVQRGLQASYFNQAIEVSSLRTKLQHLLKNPGYPQILLCLGVPMDTQAPSPRRPLADVFSSN